MTACSDKQNIQLSIIIVSFNRKQLLEQCLESLASYIDRQTIEVIVVDNNSTDGTADLVCTKFPKVMIKSNKRNLGFAKANNQGIKYSRGSFILLLNDDTVVLPKAIESLLTFMLSRPDVAAVGCQLRNSDGTIQPSCGEFPSILKIAWQTITRVKMKRMIVWSYDIIREVDWITGACMLISRTALDKVGMLDEDYFMYHEDEDWCYRARQAGFKIYFIPDGQVIHHKGKHWEVWDPRILVENRKGLMLFFRKHYSGFALLELKVFTVLVLSLELLYTVILSMLDSKASEKANRRARVAYETLVTTLRF